MQEPMMYLEQGLGIKCFHSLNFLEFADLQHSPLECDMLLCRSLPHSHYGLGRQGWCLPCSLLHLRYPHSAWHVRGFQQILTERHKGMPPFHMFNISNPPKESFFF